MKEFSETAAPGAFPADLIQAAYVAGSKSQVLTR
jgi:hypothetical protein